MTSGSPEQALAPVLVLGLGNLLLHDDGVGLTMLNALEQKHGADDLVEFIDGGTRGMVLATLLADRKALLLLDAVALGDDTGVIHEIINPQDQTVRAGTGAHEANVGEVLAAAALTGDLPSAIRLVGIEPEDLTTGIGLTKSVENAVESAVILAEEHLRQLKAGL